MLSAFFMGVVRMEAPFAAMPAAILDINSARRERISESGVPDMSRFIAGENNQPNHPRRWKVGPHYGMRIRNAENGPDGAKVGWVHTMYNNPANVDMRRRVLSPPVNEHDFRHYALYENPYVFRHIRRKYGHHAVYEDSGSLDLDSDSAVNNGDKATQKAKMLYKNRNYTTYSEAMLLDASSDLERSGVTQEPSEEVTRIVDSKLNSRKNRWPSGDSRSHSDSHEHSSDIGSDDLDRSHGLRSKVVPSGRIIVKTFEEDESPNELSNERLFVLTP